MSQGDDGAAGTGGPDAMVGKGETGGATTLMNLIRQRQDAAGSTQILDLSYANLEVFPTEIEFLREVLEKLTMSHNSIRTLPLQLNMFTSLRYLNIRANSIRIFPAVLCHLSSLEILDMSRNKISRFPDSFGNLMHLRVLSISRNRIEVIPAYVGDMEQLQFLKIEQNPLTFPPSDIADHSGQDMEGWLRRLKAFLSSRGTQPQSSGTTQVEDTSSTPTPAPRGPLPQRTARSTSSDSLGIPPTHRQSKSEPGLRLSIPNSNDRSGSHSATPEPTTHKLTRVNSQHANHNDDHYRFISHSRGVSGDSTSSFGSTASNDGDKYSDVYFQRLAAQPPLTNPLPPDKLRLVEAARGILFALSQIYRAVKQCVGCVTEEKLGLLFNRLLQTTSSSMTQLIQALDRFDSTAHSQIPDQNTCSEILRCCESNVVAFRKLVNMVQTQIRAISLAADARLVRNLVLQLHGALSEIRLAWDALVPLIQAASGEPSTALVDPNHPVKDHKEHQPILQHSVLLSSSHHHGHHQPHPFQLSPTMQATPTWHPIQMPQRSQNMSRTSNHSNQSVTNLQADEDEDTHLLLIVEHAIEAARRLIQSLTETCMTRFESHLTSPQLRPTHRNRSVSASPPRSSGSSGSSQSSGHNNSGSNGSNGSAKTVQDEQGRSLTMSPLQLSTDASGSGAPSSATTSTSASDSNPTLIRSPLFSNSADSVPYSNGMCLSLPIDKGPAIMKTTATTTTVTTIETTTLATTGSAISAGQNENPVPRTERRSTTGSHSKVSSRTYDPALPSIPQNEASESGPSPKSQVSSTTPGGMAVTPRSASVSVGSSGGYVPSNHGTLSSSSLPTQGFLSGHGPHPHFQSSHPPSHLQPGTPGQYSSSSIAYPFVTGNTLNLPASQLWREMRDCLLQMTEIVKRLDLDLTMIRTEDHQPLHPHHQNHINHHYVHHSAYHHPQPPQSHQYPHHHLHGREGPHPYQHGVPPHPHSGPSELDSNALRRRFGMGISDFVKSVVVISTLVRQLSSTGSRSGAGSGGTGSLIVGPGDVSTTISTTITSTTVSMSATPRVGSGGSGESNHLSPVTGSSNGLLSESSPESKVSSTTMSSSSSATGLALTASPEKILASSSSGQQSSHPPSHPHHHPLTRYQSQPSLPLTQQQQQQQQPEIFSRLVMTNVSNLTKITKDLTMRMPRSSFRDLMLPQSSPSAHPVNTSSSSTSLFSASGGGGSVMNYANSFAGAGIGSGTTTSSSVGSGGYGSGYSYGPAGASILALRKGSLI